MGLKQGDRERETRVRVEVSGAAERGLERK